MLLEVADASVGVSRCAAERAAGNAVFPVERIHAARELADIAKLVDQARSPVAFHEFRLVGDGDVGAAELHGPETANGFREVFRFGSKGQITSVNLEKVEEGVVHGGRFAVRHGVPKDTERLCFSVYTVQFYPLLSAHLGLNSKISTKKI